MTDASAKPKSNAAVSGGTQLLIDLGPIAIFVIAFNVLQRFPALKDNAVYYATAIFIVATLATIAYCKLTRGKVPPVLFVTGILVVLFGGLTLLLHDRTFIQIKPTAAYLFYAAAIVGALAFKQNIWKLLFGHAFTLPDRIWNVLALRWAGFFVLMAGLNEVIRHTQSFDFWINSKPIVAFVPTFLFALLNTPLVMKHGGDPDAPAAEAPQQ